MLTLKPAWFHMFSPAKTPSFSSSHSCFVFNNVPWDACAHNPIVFQVPLSSEALALLSRGSAQLLRLVFRSNLRAWEQMKKHAERESKKRHNDPLNEAWLYTALLVIHDVVGCEVGSNGKTLILPPDRTTKRPHCTARHQHHATLHKPHTAAPTHWPVEDIRCIF